MKNFPKIDNFFVRNATAVAITIVTLLMILAAILFYFQGKADDEAEGWVMHTYQVTGHIQLLFNRIKDVELGQRGYIITGDDASLAPYYDALKDSLGDDAKSTRLEQHHSIAEELNILRKFTEDNPIQGKNLDELASDIKELLDYWAATIQLRHDKGKTMGRQFDFQRGDKLMNNLRSLAAIMMAEENNLLSSRIKADETSTRNINIFTFSGIAFFYISIVMFIWFYQKSRREAHITQQQLIEKLANSNTELERFAYVASHDMQEPLRMITNFSELIAKEYDNKLDEDGKEYIKIVTESSTRMQRMVNDLLEYARIGGDAMSFATINVAKELKHVLENLSAATPANCPL